MRRRAGRRIGPRGFALAAMAVAVAVVAAGCGGSSDQTAPTTAAPTTVAPTTVAPTTVAPTTSTTATSGLPLAPLTGLRQTSRAAVNRSALVVKIDNVNAARPQTGINQADVVYEQMVEGGLTRLAAVFQSQLPDTVGPVRSARTTDEGITNNLNYPVFAYSGANADFLAELEKQPVVNVNADNHPGLFTRAGPNVAPHNLFAEPAELLKFAEAGKGAPPELFDYRSAAGQSPGAGAVATSSATVSFPSARAVWTWNGQSGTWARAQNGTPHVDSAGQQVEAANVVIQAIPYVTALTQANGAPIPKGQMTGTGQAWILTDGKMVHANWSRPGDTSVTSFTDSAGHSVLLTPGKTWVELLPTGRTPTFTS